MEICVEKPPTHQKLLLCEKVMPVVNGTLYAKCKTELKQTKGQSQWSSGVLDPWIHGAMGPLGKFGRRRPHRGHESAFWLPFDYIKFPHFSAGCKRLVANNWQLPKCRRAFSCPSCCKYPPMSVMWLRWLVILFKSSPLSSSPLKTGAKQAKDSHGPSRISNQLLEKKLMSVYFLDALTPTVHYA